MSPPGPVRTTAALLAAGGAAWLLGERLDEVGTRTPDRGPLPGDARHDRDALVRTRATTIAAPPVEVWPWLVQLGYGRAGWYALDLLERSFGVARSVDEDGTVSWRSLRTIAQRHQQLAVGDRIPLTEHHGFEVVELEPQRHLVAVLDGARLRMVWTLLLRDHGEATRLVTRTATSGQGPVADAALRLLLDPGHAVMELAQLRGIKVRAEGYLDADRRA